MDKVALLERKLQRECAARKEAERLLEEKSLQLYHANLQLKQQYELLEGKAGTTEQALQETQGRYELLVEQVHDFVFKTDAHGVFSYVNSACTRILGYNDQELLGHPYTKIIIGADKERVENFYRDLDSLPADNYLEFRVYAKDGTRRWVGQKVQPVNKEGELFEIIGVARDITTEKEAEKALRLSEEKYRGIIENMQLGLLEVDGQNRIVRAFPAFCDMTDYREDEILGLDANEVFLDKKNQAIMNSANEDRKKGKYSVYEIQINKKDGTPIWVLISGAPIIDRYGVTIGSIGIHYDLSDRKALESELKRARREAEHARQAEKQFLANMSHEIRNPINAMVGMVNLLYDTELSADQTNYLDTVKYAAELLLSLISGVLDIAKIESGELESQAAPFDLDALCQSVIGTMSYQAHEKGIGLVYDNQASLETQLIGDAKFVNQILVNLLSNAAKFTSEGEIGLATSVLQSEGEQQWIKFEVWDTGIGIPEGELPHIFERFKQAGKDTQVRYGGTGLGLTITRQLVQHLGGEITVVSYEEKGTRFSVVLPFTQSIVPLSKKEPYSPVAITNAAMPSTTKILVAEDNPMNQRYLEGLLKKWEIDFDISNNGVEALEMATEHIYDIVLMDIRMPEMDGYEATRRIRKLPAHQNGKAVIIALTASAMVDDLAKAQAAGCNEHLAKPFTPNQLLEVISRYTGKKMNTAETENPEKVDQARIAELYGEDADHCQMIMQMFLEVVPGDVSLLTEAKNTGDADQFKALAHRMKPNFDMVGLPRGTQIMEKLQKSDFTRLDIDHLWGDFQEFYPWAVKAVRTHLAQMEKIISG